MVSIGDMMPDRDDFESRVINSVTETTIDGPLVKLDPNEDAWEYGPPPPKGVYEVKCILARDGITEYKNKNGGSEVNFSIAIDAKIVNNADYDGIPVFPRVSTRMIRGKDICTAAGWLDKYLKTYQPNTPLPKEATPRNLLRWIEDALKREPVLKAEIDWRASYEYTEKDGTTKYENVFNSYDDFPDDPNKAGHKAHIVKVQNVHSGLPVEVRAMTQVTRFYARNETPKESAKAVTFAGGNKVQTQPLQSLPQGVGQSISSGPVGPIQQAINPQPMPLAQAPVVPGKVQSAQTINAQPQPGMQPATADELELIG